MEKNICGNFRIHIDPWGELVLERPKPDGSIGDFYLFELSESETAKTLVECIEELIG